jgi:hypothetical protein
VSANLSSTLALFVLLTGRPNRTRLRLGATLVCLSVLSAIAVTAGLG